MGFYWFGKIGFQGKKRGAHRMVKRRQEEGVKMRVCPVLFIDSIN